MHSPKYHVQPNRKRALVMQNAVHPDRLNRNSDRMQMSLAVFCLRFKKRVGEKEDRENKNN